MLAKKFIISGIVQGVFFRKSTEEFVHTNLPNLKGYVKNLPTKQVEIYAIGSEEELVTLKEYLQEGPQAATVEQVHEENSEFTQSYSTFSIIR